MATLHELRDALRQYASSAEPNCFQPLSDSQGKAAFEIIRQGSHAYEDFILPSLVQLFESSSFSSNEHISVLEVGPGAKSVLGSLPLKSRHKIKAYTAIEPNEHSVKDLKAWLCPNSPREEPPFPSLESPIVVQHEPYTLASHVSLPKVVSDESDIPKEGFDLILFCHSMYGMTPKRKYIENALQMLARPSDEAVVVVFHRDQVLQLDGLASHLSTCHPTGTVHVQDNDHILDRFAAYIAGLTIKGSTQAKWIQEQWRKTCREMCTRSDSDPRLLIFHAPEVMITFNKHANSLYKLEVSVPRSEARLSSIKNREARSRQPAAVFRPETVDQVQQCVGWALNHNLKLTVLGGSHSGQCIWPNAVAVDMSAFDQVHIVSKQEIEEDANLNSSHMSHLVVPQAGSQTGPIIEKCLAHGLTLPLGTRPSVGAGLWLQGGIGHLSRSYGLACDAIEGAVIVSVATGEIHCVGQVPTRCRPPGTTRLSSEKERDLLWAVKGAGTNFGIVISATLRAQPALNHSIVNWVVPVESHQEARGMIENIDAHVVAGGQDSSLRQLGCRMSVDMYLYWEAEKLHLGVTVFYCHKGRLQPETLRLDDLQTILGCPPSEPTTVDGIGLFDAELHMSGMHGGHTSGKTSAFKRCLFLKDISRPDILNTLLRALETRPSSQCYFHLLQGGGQIQSTYGPAPAFGCRHWDFACIVTGVWSRSEDGTATSRAGIRWVYDVAYSLLPFSEGVYGADLGPDPRDAELAARAFGTSLRRLARLKKMFDPQNVLAYACPLAHAPQPPKLIVLVTGETCAGKDYCAEIWADTFKQSYHDEDLQVMKSSISDATKGAYAESSSADLHLLLHDREYKEAHRESLTKFFQDQLVRNPCLPEEHFLHIVNNVADMDVLLISGMRDEAPIATFAPLASSSKMVEVRVEAPEETRLLRGACISNDLGQGKDKKTGEVPTLNFKNDEAGPRSAEAFCKRVLFHLVRHDLEKIRTAIPSIPNFPRAAIDFRHVLNIAQEPGCLKLCTDLLRTHSAAAGTNFDAVVSCEAGGFVFASPFAAQVDRPLILIREAGKLPPPTVAVQKLPSHVSSGCAGSSSPKTIEIGQGALRPRSSVIFVDDVLATGNTLCAVLQLLSKAGIPSANISVMVVAEFPAHGGRRLLCKSGFGEVKVQSLLVFGGT